MGPPIYGQPSTKVRIKLIRLDEAKLKVIVGRKLSQLESTTLMIHASLYEARVRASQEKTTLSDVVQHLQKMEDAIRSLKEIIEDEPASGATMMYLELFAKFLDQHTMWPANSSSVGTKSALLKLETCVIDLRRRLGDEFGFNRNDAFAILVQGLARWFEAAGVQTERDNRGMKMKARPLRDLLDLIEAELLDLRIDRTRQTQNKAIRTALERRPSPTPIESFDTFDLDLLLRELADAIRMDALTDVASPETMRP